LQALSAIRAALISDSKISTPVSTNFILTDNVDGQSKNMGCVLVPNLKMERMTNSPNQSSVRMMAASITSSNMPERLIAGIQSLLWDEEASVKMGALLLLDALNVKPERDEISVFFMNFTDQIYLENVTSKINIYSSRISEIGCKKCELVVENSEVWSINAPKLEFWNNLFYGSVKHSDIKNEDWSTARNISLVYGVSFLDEGTESESSNYYVSSLVGEVSDELENIDGFALKSSVRRVGFLAAGSDGIIIKNSSQSAKCNAEQQSIHVRYQDPLSDRIFSYGEQVRDFHPYKLVPYQKWISIQRANK